MKISELEGLFWAELMQVLGYDPAAAMKNPPVRRSWPEEGSPFWKRNENVLFLKVYDSPGEDITVPIDTVMENGERDILMHKGQTRVLRLSLIAYGPDSYDNLVLIRRHFQTSQDKAVRAKRIYLIPKSDTPQRVPEIINSQWWQRADLDLYFNCLMTWEQTINAIEEVPVTVGGNGQTSHVEEESMVIKKKE